MAKVVVLIMVVIVGHGLWILVRAKSMDLIMGSDYNCDYSHGRGYCLSYGSGHDCGPG